MKVLFNHHLPFSLAHGGSQIQIEQTKIGLEKIGVEVEPLRWWDDTQKGEILHHFGRIPVHLLRAARQKGMKVIFSDLLTETGSRSPSRLLMQKLGERGLRYVLPRPTVAALSWDSYREADACVALTEWEAHLMVYLFRGARERIRVVPNGVEAVFLQQKPTRRGDWLVCTATITERKRVLELAEAAVEAQTPLWIVGRPYSETDPYGQRFLQLARANSKIVRYEGAISDRARLAQIYGDARGFVLFSTMESLSLSALEASACGCPLLLSEQPWATWTFKEKASYCPADGSLATRAKALRLFYDDAPKLPVPTKPLSWVEVAESLKTIYSSLVRTAGT